jgi:hypothetical protein
MARPFGEPIQTRYRPIDMARPLVTALLAVIFIGALTGCAAGSGGTAAGPTAAPPVGTPPSPEPSASGPPSPGPPPATPPTGRVPSPASTELTLTGRVEQGVEPGCLIMRQDSTTYELLGADRGIVRAGAQVVVTGHLVTGIASHCMQGLLFQVTSARPG